MTRTKASSVALGGMMAALAVVIMCLGGMIPVATFVCPMLCMLLLQLVCRACGRRIAWAWYGAVMLLSVLMSPDKEAAAVFVFLGYYPIVKPWLDRKKMGKLLKFLLFNGSMLVMYWLLIRIMGMEQIAEDYRELGTAMTAALLILGNITFYLLDVVLGRAWRKKERKRVG